ncbi:MAG: preprotein translocase subunit YajC [Oxalobacter sp.]|nr:MAG: preprotein translocase subunit YajC [Oxalobacter sp.]
MGANFNLMDYLPFILIIVVFYFLMFRPQQQRAKRQREMLEALSVGNEVLTAGGIMGKIVDVSSTIVRIEIAPHVTIAIQKAAVTTLLPPGTLDAPENLPPPPPSCCA